MDDRIVFMGSPDFAVPILEMLAAQFKVVGVVTQPDRPAGRGRSLMPPPVKETALEMGIPLIQPKSIRKEPESREVIRTWNPAVIVVAAFGQILPKEVLELPPKGCLNVHASLLPRWRGVAPIQAAILNGDQETGITIMKMDEGIDTGDILTQGAIPIQPDDTGGSLYEKLTRLGADLLAGTLPAYLRGELQPIPQGYSPTSYAPMVRKSDGELDFNEPAVKLARKVRAYQPWPGTYTYWEGKILKINKAHAVEEASPGIGIFTIFGDLPAIGTREGLLVIDEIQPSGKKTMQGEVFLHGARDWAEETPPGFS